ncbi:aminopeptidase N [Streptomyces radicis]|uniref:Aminopeptidase N n=1 Tax=Streptomyces radicis TaxID=1750517 RepID=A0A3A9WE88_9ACTN|nr:aminopeptidase N [Streptomyces radicis]RKN04357.1 aminopeptidase N [Streptomyces radicis]RKN14865.1 aminopeptidase N [Streptomyces radicis]
MATLTRSEAEDRARLIEVRRYAIDLDFTGGEETFTSATTIRFHARQAGDTFAELRPTAVHRATLDGEDLDPAAFADGRIALTGLAEGEHELSVTADLPYSRTGEGIHRFTDPADGLTYLYSMCCMTESPLVYAAFDQPDLKAVFDVTVTAPEDWTVLGNGVATRVDGEPGRWICATTPPLSTYLMAVVAGPYHSVRTEHAGLPFGLHVRRSLAEHLDKDADELFDLTRRCFDRYAELYDEPYPFDSYDQAFVPEFNAGAMENPGLVTLRDEFIYRSAVTETQRQTRGVVIAHEMAHMWFGDLVTLRWWDDIWLNESFAEFMGYQVIDDTTDYAPWTEFAVARKTWGYDADQRPTTHPVAPEPDAVPDTASAWLNFDGISYAKGASALRQLVTWLGEKDFVAGINDHFARHRFGNATLADFIGSMARASGRPVPEWADRWLRTSGPDTLAPEVIDGAGEWRLRLAHSGGRPHRLTLGAYDEEEGRAVLRERHNLDLPAADGTAERAFPGARPALLVVNDGDLTYAKVRLDRASRETALRVLPTLPDPLTRTVVWASLRDMVRDGELDPLLYADAARRLLPDEPATALVESVIDFASGQVAGVYLAGGRRATALRLVGDLAAELLGPAATDPTRRLIAARAAIGAATEPGELRAWWEAGTVPGGPHLDPELRWLLLHRLAVLGATTREEIAAEAARDATAVGEEGAARCRAALPDAEAKAAAWEAMFDPADRLSNYLFVATAQGFWHPEHEELLTPYVERYFPAATALAARRGHTLGVMAARYAYPAAIVGKETARLTEEWLRDHEPVPALARGLVNQLDDMRRALDVRHAFRRGGL